MANNDCSGLSKIYQCKGENTTGANTKDRPKVIIISAKRGDMKVSLNELNYITVEQRVVQYHLTKETVKSAHVMRTSFKKTIEPYLAHENLIFIKPSLLINLDNIKYLSKDSVEFFSGEIMYFPKNHHDEIYEKWAK